MNPLTLDELAKSARATPAMRRTPLDGLPGVAQPETEPRTAAQIAAETVRECRKIYEAGRPIK